MQEGWKGLRARVEDPAILYPDIPGCRAQEYLTHPTLSIQPYQEGRVEMERVEKNDEFRPFRNFEKLVFGAAARLAVTKDS